LSKDLPPWNTHLPTRGVGLSWNLIVLVKNFFFVPVPSFRTEVLNLSNLFSVVMRWWLGSRKFWGKWLNNFFFSFVKWTTLFGNTKIWEEEKWKTDRCR
jgi:hypothetical protein